MKLDGFDLVKKEVDLNFSLGSGERHKQRMESSKSYKNYKIYLIMKIFKIMTRKMYFMHARVNIFQDCKYHSITKLEIQLNFSKPKIFDV